nr:hypothetical protein [Caballeronia terrestris]
MGPFTLTASRRVHVGRRVVLDGLARRDAREVHHRIDPAEVVKGRRRQVLEARRIGDVRAQVNCRAVVPTGQRRSVVLAPRREHHPEALGREEPRQGLTKSSGHPDEHGGGRVHAPLCCGAADSGGVAGDHRVLSIQLGHFESLSVDIGYYKSIYLE